MKVEQLTKLRQIQERLADMFFEESDTEKWSDMQTRDSRGDRYWFKKNATATLTIIGRIENLLALRDGRASGGPNADQVKDDEAQLDREIAKAEKEAEELGRNVVRLHASKSRR